MRSLGAFLAGWLLLLSTAAWADSAGELQLLQEFFSPKGVESRSTRLTGAALEQFARRPMVGEYLPEKATTAFRLLVESETTAIYEAVVSRDGLAEMWSAFFHRGPLGSKLEAIKCLNIPPYLVAVEYPRLVAQPGRNAAQEARLLQLQRLFMTTETFKDYFNQNRATYETIGRLVETGKMAEAEAAAKTAALVGVRLYGESKSEGALALQNSTTASSKGQESTQSGSEVRVSGFLDSVLGLLHLPPGVSPPLMSALDYIFVEALDDNWYLFRNIAAEPLKEKSADNE
jgi:hypothetical protein